MIKEEMSRTVKWFFGLPLAYTLWVILSQFIPAGIGGEYRLFVLSIISYMLFITVVAAVVKYFLKFPVYRLFTEQKPFRWKEFLTGFSAMFLTGIISEAVWYLVSPGSFTFTFRIERWAVDFCLSLILVALAATFEELVFRSYIAYFLHDEMPSSNRSTLIHGFIGAALFAAAHFSNPEVNGSSAFFSMTFYFMFGFAMMILTLKTKSIAGPIGIHIGNNLISAWLVTYPDSALNTNALVTKSNAVGPGVLIQGAICLVISIAAVIHTSRKASGSLR